MSEDESHPSQYEIERAQATHQYELLKDLFLEVYQASLGEPDLNIQPFLTDAWGKIHYSLQLWSSRWSIMPSKAGRSLE